MPLMEQLEQRPHCGNTGAYNIRFCVCKLVNHQGTWSSLLESSIVKVATVIV